MRRYLSLPAAVFAPPRPDPAGGADVLLLDVSAHAPADLPALKARLCARPLGGPALFLRLGGLDDPDLGPRLDALMPAAPEGLVLPGLRRGADLADLGSRLAVAEAEHGRPDGATRILGWLDNAAGLLAAGPLAGASPRLCALAWDPAALAAELGAAPRDAAGALIPPLAQARALLRLAAAAAGVEAVDVGDDGTAFWAAARRDGFGAGCVRVGGGADA
ncbi:aldolase/citrate lyase family protein [Methylobacterium organophilum]|uniref:aldolase/citrate lyase family protein n=1 Tax=Methylobacterium organophilum TaxID=410 RepID=UPI001F133DB6|nr:aldolase/citrate lyase family protein [Methylobacterium organophilum]UMY17258.1 aldolase/citrate lyase family protein [Methylobacterium organophilum]